MHDLGNIEFPGWLKNDMHVVGIDFETNQIERFDFLAISDHVDKDVAKNVFVKIGEAFLSIGGEQISCFFDVDAFCHSLRC